MKLEEASSIMRGKDVGGYRVSFEARVNGMLRGDFFPDRDEPAYDTLEAAALAADLFAAADPEKKRFVNVRVIFARDFTPVSRDRTRNVL
jgi:hypothetical protein